MRNPLHRDEEGQILLWVALVAGLLIIFTAMAVDMGNIYYHKARLSNAVDAAVLEGVKLYGTFDNSSVQITQARAQQYAADVFTANYGVACGASGGPTCTWTWCPIDVVGCPAGNALSLKLQASQAPVNTSFMAYWPQWAQWHIGDTGRATRSILVMSLILDRSGSMKDQSQGGDGGGAALQAAVPNFVADFVQGTDYVSMISFSSDARVDVQVTQNFVTPIDNAVAAYSWVGGTFGTGAGSQPCPILATNPNNCPPLTLADAQNATGVNSAGQGSPITKVVIYFTDGLMNTIQDTFNCTNLGNVPYNYGGFDPSQGNLFDFSNPSQSIINGQPDQYPYDDYSYYYGGGSGCGGGNGFCGSNPPYGSGGVRCQGITTFPSQLTGTQTAFTRAAITAEAKYRAIISANIMRQEDPQTFFYVVGLGNAVSGDTTTEQFLNTLANDPSGPANYGCTQGHYVSPYTNCYDQTLPQGLFLVVPDCPSSNCTAELNQAFQVIASAIRLRLSL